MKIRALVPFSTGTITMEKYEIKEVSYEVGARLVAAGLVTEISGDGLPPVTASDNGKVLTAKNGAWGAGVQEYWIPVTVSGSEFYIPNDKALEVAIAICNADRYWVRGAVIGNTYYPGYVSCHQDFIVPLSKSFMQNLGFDCAGKIHIVKGDPYTVSIEPDKFIVTLTPTDEDFSGTMDKTVAEIDAAYKAGRQVVFHVLVNANQWYEMDLTERGGDSSTTYPSYNACGIVGSFFGKFYTGTTDDGTKQTYATEIYTLTPAT